MLNRTIYIKFTLRILLLMNQNQYPDSVQTHSLKTVFYAQRRPDEPPFLVAVDLKPYQDHPDDSFQTVQLVDPPQQVHPFCPQRNVDRYLPPAQNVAAWPEIEHGDPYIRDPIGILNGQLNPRMQRITNGFTPCRKFLSACLIFINLIMTVTIIVFILLFALVSVLYDTFSLGASIARFFALSLGLCLLLFRIILIPYLSCKQQVTRNEKLSFGFSILMPFLKYHVIRLNPNFNGKIKKMYTQDWLVTMYEIVIAINAIICYAGSQAGHEEWRHRDPIILLMAIFCLIDALIMWPLMLAVHQQWIKYRVQHEILIN
jgi:hypothetical protein